MSVLILANSAPNYHFFFNSLAKTFSEAGDTIVYAVDSKYSRSYNKIDDFSQNVYEFSRFFAVHTIDENLLESYRKYNLNYALLSDFERAEVYNIWGKEQFDNSYFEKLKSALLAFFEEIIDHHEIELVVYENVSNTFAYFAYIVASRKGVKYKGFTPSRLPGRFEITEGPFDFKNIKEMFNKIEAGSIVVPEKVKNSVAYYIQGIDGIEPDYMKSNNLSNVSIAKRYLAKDKAVKLFFLLKYLFKKSSYNFQIGNPLKTHLKLFYRNLWRRLKCQIVSKYYDDYKLDNRFFLYPLHFHPESSTSILSGNSLDEYEVIRSICFNLPEGTTLYVKDHKSAWGYPSINFYKKVKRLPNVKLLSPEEPTKVLIKKSLGVITLTSTVGYEALLLGKPVYLFGRVFYEFHKNVRFLRARDDIFKILEESLDKKVDNVEEYNQHFVQAYWMTTYEGTLNLLSQRHLDEEISKNMMTVLRDG